MGRRGCSLVRAGSVFLGVAAVQATQKQVSVTVIRSKRILDLAEEWVLAYKDVIDTVRRQLDTPAVSALPDAVRVVPATERDIPLILSFIRRLAEYEKLSDACVATEDGIRSTLFVDPPAAEVLLAYDGRNSRGFRAFLSQLLDIHGTPRPVPGGPVCGSRVTWQGNRLHATLSSREDCSRT